MLKGLVVGLILLGINICVGGLREQTYTRQIHDLFDNSSESFCIPWIGKRHFKILIFNSNIG